MASNDDDRNPWRTKFELTLADHMRFLTRLVDETEDHELESELYHLYNTALSFNAFRTSTSTLSLSVQPQATMKVPSIPIPEVEPSDRVLRSQSSDASQMDEEELSTSFNELSIQSETSGVLSDTGNEPASAYKEDRARIPDFVTLITTAHGGQRVLFLHEVKPYPSFYFHEGLSRRARYNIVIRAFQIMPQQVLEQAQATFHQYPADRELHVMGFVGLYFAVYKFLREKTPEFGQPTESPEDIPVARTVPYYLLNGNRTDYHPQFKMWWTRVKRAKGGLRMI